MAANMVVDRIEKPMLNIFEFIDQKNYQIELGSWFRDIWIPMYKKENVLITNDILCFIHYGIIGYLTVYPEDLKIIKMNFRKSLKTYNLEYTELKYDNPLALEYEYIQNEIKTLTSNNLVQKTWILLPVRNFKKLIMSLRTKVADEIKDYYITIEDILVDYLNYMKEHETIQSKQLAIDFENKLKIEENKSEQLALEFESKLKIKEQELQEEKTKIYN